MDSCPPGTASVLQGTKPRALRCIPEHRCVDGLREGTKTPCECNDATCTDCTVKASGTTCARCDATRFLAAGACVKNVECRGSKIVKKGVKLQDSCSCEQAGASCQSCVLSKVGTVVLSSCLSCRKLFLHATQCVDTCPVGYANYGLHSKFGRKW